MRQRLIADRELTAVQREDDWERRAQQAEHRIKMSDVDEQAAAAKRARRERARDAAEADGLAALYRRATRSGARARVRAQIQGSAEMRALRVTKVRTAALLAGIPVLAAFAAWSTTGAQAGAVRLLNLQSSTAAWWASWGVEPALITVVALIIIGRAVLRFSGGDTDWRATLAEWTALSLSLALNIIGGWEGGWEGLAGALPHSIGPLGAAGTAFLIGLFDSYVTAARPWDGVLTLAELNLVPAATPGGPLVWSEQTAGPDRQIAGPDRTADEDDDLGQTGDWEIAELTGPVQPRTAWVNADGRRTLRIIPAVAPRRTAGPDRSDRTAGPDRSDRTAGPDRSTGPDRTGEQTAGPDRPDRTADEQTGPDRIDNTVPIAHGADRLILGLTKIRDAFAGEYDSWEAFLADYRAGKLAQNAVARRCGMGKDRINKNLLPHANEKTLPWKTNAAQPTQLASVASI